MTDTDPQNGPAGEQPQEKSAKQLEKEAKKAAKLEKLKAKLDKKSATPAVQKDKPEVRVFIICLHRKIDLYMYLLIMNITVP